MTALAVLRKPLEPLRGTGRADLGAWPVVAGLADVADENEMRFGVRQEGVLA